ncbi:nitroreductase family deazaflavin-dependent oxidoreductase [Nocardiopsis sediminis]|uniref:Nitroreductase family deazaflavin-dependent oxidoreductase n=1 Tax=Nocardiopsis sediminis TaxID=1778267 RepID=A0ABV8FMS8_9ACTN
MSAQTRRPGPVLRLRQALLASAKRMSASPAFARVAPHVLPRFDRLLGRLSGGRLQTTRGTVPGLLLTTTGRRSGLPRQAPVACLPERATGSFLVVGSNFGREQHPAWTGNLLHTPQARVNYRGREIDVTAELLSPADKAEVWPRLTAMWPYDTYAARSGRDLRVFRLVPRSG